MQSAQSYQNKSVASAGLLFILLEKAHELPVSHTHIMYIFIYLVILNLYKWELYLCVQLKKSGKEPKAAAELVLGGTSYKSKAGNFFCLNIVMQDC